MCTFPDIQYDPNFALLNNQRIPMGTYTYLTNIGIAGDLSLAGIATMEQLEKHINGMINAYDGDDSALFEIFRLIQVWGGPRGGMVFIKNPNFKNKWDTKIRDKYRELVNVCIGIKADGDFELGIRDMDIDKVYNAVYSIINAIERGEKVVPGFRVAFITKHTRFWLQKNNFKNPLPIFDSVMSWGLFKQGYAEESHLKCYWKCMIEKAISLNNGMTLLALERQLFNYFPTIDERKKGKTSNKKGMTAKHHASPEAIPNKWWKNDIIEGEWIMLNGIRTLLFVGQRPSLSKWYFCELNIWGWNGIGDINIIANDIIKFVESKGYTWKSKNPQYKYVAFDQGEMEFEKAKKLMKTISDFVKNI